ncbi:MAG: exodeoxyribonuclease VII large subunit [Bacteroidia bacterium]
MPQTYTVSQLNATIKALLERAPFLQRMEVKGEISNLTRHSSGHYYFSLKDENSQISCVMFRQSAASLLFEPMAGDQVVATADISVYLPRGNYQLQVHKLEKEGMGSLYQRYLELKARLEKEGLFDNRHKKALPRFAKTLGVVSSPTGAVIRDIINTVNRRFPATKILLAPSKVQGEDAVPQLIAALSALDQMAEVDLIILARGGGSLEDLWCFNDEALVRCLFTLKKPVIAAIGHETDFSLADFVADQRAPTPTAAAELATPNQLEIEQFLDEQADLLANELRLRVQDYEQHLAEIRQQLANGLRQQIRLRGQQLDGLEQRIQALDYRSVMARGFSITTQDGVRISSVKQLKKDQALKTFVKDGSFVSDLKV